MADDIYNSSFTGSQIDEAVSDVRANKGTWNNAALKADENAEAIAELEQTLNDSVSELDQKISDNTEAVEEVKTAVGGHATDIEALQLGVQANQNAITQKADASALSESVQDLESQIAEKADVEALEAQITQLQAQLADKAPMYTYGTTDLEAGVTALETGRLHFVYEA